MQELRPDGGVVIILPSIFRIERLTFCKQQLPKIFKPPVFHEEPSNCFFRRDFSFQIIFFVELKKRDPLCKSCVQTEVLGKMKCQNKSWEAHRVSSKFRSLCNNKTALKSR